LKALIRQAPGEGDSMLKGLHPLLTADLLHALRSMGHGDTVAIVDANFPASGLGPPVVEVAGATASAVLDAVLTVFPLDAEAMPPAATMEVVDAPQDVPAPVAEFAAVFTEHGLDDVEIGRLPRRDFYQQAREAFAIVRTGEMRPYGNILLVKGTVNRYERRPTPLA
jgi:L-fucose mutarotase